MDELIAKIKKLKLSKDDVIMEAETVEEYGEWTHPSLIGYGYKELMEAAEKM